MEKTGQLSLSRPDITEAHLKWRNNDIKSIQKLWGLGSQPRSLWC